MTCLNGPTLPERDRWRLSQHCWLEDQVQECLVDGRLIRVLADGCPPFSGYHLCYPSRRHLPPASALQVDALQYRR